MRDSELTERPGKAWTRWAEGRGEYEIERTWWQAKRREMADGPAAAQLWVTQGNSNRAFREG